MDRLSKNETLNYNEVKVAEYFKETENGIELIVITKKIFNSENKTSN